MNAIEITDLTKQYGDVTAVSELSIAIEQGEVFGFLGPNGAGKSTTINMLLDFVRPTSGSATVLGYDTQTETDQISKRVGILPEGYDIYERLTGRKHLEFAIRTKDADDDPDELLARVGLDQADADRPAGGYSKGMRQRLATGMALVGDPELLIMDEPSTGLDPTGIREMQELVQAESERGTTVFFSSHILEHVEAVCDRIGILNQGELIALDTLEGLRESLGDGATMTITVSDPPKAAAETVDAITGVTDVTATGRQLEASVTDPRSKATVITELDALGVTITDVRIDETSLESLFAALVAEDGTVGAGIETQPQYAEVPSEVSQ
ncbi:ABC transporter ATP-binding protein [Natrialba sp. SSL1]|uniref:ABC transporter ATP-binding protein n=1 Tax=Natrialba sp. SSL1 TaxID=1869245 RepID=UPI0008F961E7|nr:ABC transporter ATP-binding protein [Natrialba sp. SSL1]OIB58959.1 copper ABC transporter ATP-binding protein [Natrialba sp. SSL1]